MQSRFENALIEFEQWLVDSNTRIDQFFSTNSTTHSLSKRQNSSNSTADVKSYDKLTEITQIFEEVTKQFVNTESQDKEVDFINPSKGFSDIYNGKVKSAAELKLISEVETHLSTQDKEKAIANNTKASSVMDQVKQAIDKNQQLFVQLLLREKQQVQKERIQDQKEAKQKEIQSEGKMNSLGEPFGVLAEITKNMRLIVDNYKKEKNIQKDTPKQSRGFDDTVSSALKNMGKDPNHTQSQQLGHAK